MQDMQQHPHDFSFESIGPKTFSIFCFVLLELRKLNTPFNINEYFVELFVAGQQLMWRRTPELLSKKFHLSNIRHIVNEHYAKSKSSIVSDTKM